VIERARVVVRGAVQGVGFRPFVYRLATDLGLAGWVLNSSHGVFIEIEGERAALDAFLIRLSSDHPPLASIHSLETTILDAVAHTGFEIRVSEESGTPTTLVMADIATCPECLREVGDASERRHRYPFTNCTNCGPRFTIIEALPYDRVHTSMRSFPMCDDCRREYEDPRDRRFHAQPIACPACGPQLAAWDAAGRVLAVRDDALRAVAEAIAGGAVAAIKGLGGFHLVVDAADGARVARLRQRKHREEKPFALLAPSLEAVMTFCDVSPLEARLLTSPEAPIVLLQRTAAASALVADAVAPGNPRLGVMLPCTPLHHLLMREIGRPVVATSGNRSDEPICTDEREALVRLRGIADLFLVHDRPIVRHVDDSIARVLLGREQVLRRARGYAPLPVSLAKPAPPLLAVGGHLKNSVAVSSGPCVFLSQHIGDLETAEATDAFRGVVHDLERLYGISPEAVAADLHPDYPSTRFAHRRRLPVVQVQHHFAHVAACLAENGLDGPVLGVSWDGTGYGPDGTVWGGEFLRADRRTFERFAALRSFRLPGGDRAIREPRRSAVGLLYAMFGDSLTSRRRLAPVAAFSEGELVPLMQALDRRINAPETSSAGRLFDAVAALLDLRQHSSFEGQAAMALEFAVDGRETGSYPFRLVDVGEDPVRAHAPRVVVDWQPTLTAVLEDLASGVARGVIAARFHHALAEMIVGVARRAGETRVVLTGGCFQNQYLTTRAVRRLEAAGFRVYWHQRVPPNDGGIALGQIVVAASVVGEQ
jgi:hydrogenase maturation protein HypF